MISASKWRVLKSSSGLGSLLTRPPFTRGSFEHLASARGLQQNPRPHRSTLINLQALRAIAALLVVFVHLGNPHGFEARYLHVAKAMLSGLANIGHSGVDLFFVISGFIMTMTTCARPRLPGSGAFLLARVVRIYPMYWIMTALVLIVYLYRPEIVNSHSAFSPNIAASFLALPQAGDPLLLVGWSLVYEMYFYTIFAVALAFGKRSLVPVLVFWAAAMIVLNLIFASTHNPWLYVVSNPLCCEFLVGIGVALLVLSRKVHAPALCLALGCLGYAGECLFGFGTGWMTVVGAVPLALIVLGLVELELRAECVLPGIFRHLGDASYSLYLSHIPILAALGILMSHTSLRRGTRLDEIVAVTVAIVLVEAISLCIYRYVERPITGSLRRRLSQNRSAAGVRTNPSETESSSS
jgi:exopolysaccharide production protein ExoZ